MADANEQESDAKQQVTASASRAQKDAASEKKATAGVAKTSLEDHDSSATCSADEDGAQEVPGLCVSATLPCRCCCIRKVNVS